MCLFLHNSVGLAAEVLGAETGQEVPGRRSQEWKKLPLEPLADKGLILQLCLAKVVDFQFSNGIQGISHDWATVVGGLEW